MLFFHVADSFHGFVEDPRSLSSSSVSSPDHAYSCVVQWYQQDRNDHDYMRMRKNIQAGTFVLVSVFSEYDSFGDSSKTIWVEVQATTTIVEPTKQHCGNSSGSILLSPAVLHSLHIYDSNAKVCISCDHCPNPVFIAVSTVTLSRIIGQSYPNDEVECTLLQNYFDIPHRRVEAGEMAVVPAAMVENHWLVPDVQYYVYMVTQVDIPIATANNGAENNHQQQIQSAQTIFNVATRGITKVVLKGRIHCRLLDFTTIANYMEFLRWHEHKRRWENEKKVGSRRVRRDGAYEHREENNVAVLHEMSSSFSSQTLNSVHHSIAIHRDNNKHWGHPAKQIIQMVSPILHTLAQASFLSRQNPHRGGVSDATLGHLLRYVMIHTSHPLEHTPDTL